MYTYIYIYIYITANFTEISSVTQCK